MVQGIAIFGLNGGGKSTLAHAVAKQTGYFEMDVEDYPNIDKPCFTAPSRDCY